MTMRDHRLAALYQALKQPTGPHLDDETLAVIVDAELAGERVDLLYTKEIEHVEICEQCALAYSDLLMLMGEVMGDMALAADAVSPLEAYTAFLQLEIQKGVGELPRMPELAAHLAAALARQLKVKPIEELPLALLGGVIREWPSTVQLTADIVKAIAAIINRNTAALSVFLTGQAAMVWSKAFLVRAERVDNKCRLTLDGMAGQIREPQAAYEAGNDRLLTRLAIPNSPLQLEARLSRQTPLTCRLMIQLQRAKGTELAGYKIHIGYDGMEESAETDTTGIAYFNDIPIAALPELKITVEG